MTDVSLHRRKAHRRFDDDSVGRYPQPPLNKEAFDS